MNENAKNLLGEIGRQLDRHIFPVVKNGGFVWPSQSTAYLNPLGKEQYHESKRSRGSPAEPWSGAVGWQRPPSGPWITPGSWATRATPPVVSSGQGNIYRSSLTSVCEAYPGTQMWEQEEGFWLYSESSLLSGLGRKVSFLIAISAERQAVRGWAFWYSKMAGASWIGPRHTNFPDGSICAFEPTDGTWAFGDSLVELLDLYSVWALRQLHYEVLGHWPGPQAVSLPYERLLELRDGEHCGCGAIGRRYIDCCKAADMRMNLIAEAIRFGFFSSWKLRSPPMSVMQFIRNRISPPKISEVV